MTHPASTPPRRRPVFLNLVKIKLPVGALTSIFHRVSGVQLAVSVPMVLFVLGRSIEGEAGFVQMADLLRQPGAKLLVVALVWALAHHMLAGVRHMLTDINIGSTLGTARRSAWGVNVAALAVAALAVGVVL